MNLQWGEGNVIVCPCDLSPFAVQRGPHGHDVLMTQLKQALTSFDKKGRESKMQRISLRSSKERTAAPNFQKLVVVFEEAKQYQEKKLNFHFLKSKDIPFILSLSFPIWI